MPTYIILTRWTHQGLQKIKESPSRLDAGRKAFEAAGVKLKEFYMTLGQYDSIVVVEAPDDAALARANLALASKGNLETQTLRAFTEAEYRKIISGIE
ncbi:MAG: GYD domain-containing protein [Acidobacteriaceae bacterium]|nr:GYD domain-containing protein [Acidobacteriaceae bacterium]